MTLMQMKYFSTVCQLQNISMAAQQLFISQPALSSTLQELEKEVGFKLFERKSKGVVPTEESRLLLEHVDAVLRRVDLMNQAIPLIANHQNVLRIGFRSYAGENDFFRIYPKFGKMYQDTVLDIHQMANTSPWMYLDENQIDFLISATKPLPEGWAEKHEHCLIGIEELTFWGPTNHPLTQKGFLTLEEFSQIPLVFWDGHRKLLTRLNSNMIDLGYHLNIVGILPQLSGIIQFIHRGMAFGLIPYDFANSIPEISPIELPPEILPQIGEQYIKIYAFWKKETEKYTVKKQFIDYMRTLSKELE